MSNELTFFPITGFYYDIQNPDPSSSSNAPVFTGMTGAFITFTPRVPDGFTVLVSDLDLGSGNTGSTAIALPAITGRVSAVVAGGEGGTVWELCAINTVDSVGIELLANTSIISTYLAAQNVPNTQQAGDLIYDVSFTQVTYAGLNQMINNFAFVAPTSNTSICITDPSFETIPYAPI